MTPLGKYLWAALYGSHPGDEGGCFFVGSRAFTLQPEAVMPQFARHAPEQREVKSPLM
jgi:hypothetical protein